VAADGDDEMTEDLKDYITDEEYPVCTIVFEADPINKVATDFMLPAMPINQYFHEVLNGSRLGVYFIQSAEGYIKIGKSNDVIRRLGSYRTHHPMTRLVGMIACAQQHLDFNENLLHKLWEPFIVSLEWFAPVRPLVEYIRCFGNDGLGHPLELMGKPPETWKALLEFQQSLMELRSNWK
jgi:hypothetical protein